MTRRWRRLGAIAGAVACAAGAIPLATASPAAALSGPTVVASGLDNPRGMALAPDGSLLVAEAGRGGPGPCVPGPEEDEVCFGLSGAITRISGGSQSRVADGLPSLAAPDGSSALGPEDIAIDDGPQPGTYVVIGLGADPALRADLPAGAEAMASLHRLDAGGSLTKVTDLGDWEAATNPDAGQPSAAVDTNPKGLLAVYGQQFVTDAGGNVLIHRGVDGQLSNLTTFDVRFVDAPPFLGAPAGTQIPMQAVPTAVALGPDGALYVSQLTGFPFPVGGSNVYRWAADGVTTYATGFTNAIDLTFGPDGSLYLLEIAKNSLLAGEEGGRLWRIAPDGTRSVVAEEGLMFPSSVVAAPDGSVYVANCGVCAGGGEIWKYTP
jgi:hypothetical protein